MVWKQASFQLNIKLFWITSYLSVSSWLAMSLTSHIARADLAQCPIGIKWQNTSSSSRLSIQMQMAVDWANWDIQTNPWMKTDTSLQSGDCCFIWTGNHSSMLWFTHSWIALLSESTHSVVCWLIWYSSSAPGIWSVNISSSLLSQKNHYFNDTSAVTETQAPLFKGLRDIIPTRRKSGLHWASN